MYVLKYVKYRFIIYVFFYLKKQFFHTNQKVKMSELHKVSYLLFYQNS